MQDEVGEEMKKKKDNRVECFAAWVDTGLRQEMMDGFILRRNEGISCCWIAPDLTYHEQFGSVPKFKPVMPPNGMKVEITGLRQ